MNRPIFFFTATLALMLAVPAAARTVYVTDQLSVNLRAAASGSADSVKLLTSNTPLEVLGEDGDFLKVRLDDGSEGYFPKRYASTDEPRPRIISRLEKQIAKLEAELEGMRQRLGAASGELEAERAELVTQLQTTQEELAQMESQNALLLTERDAALQKYEQLAADAGNVVELAAQRDRLESENEDLRGQIQTLSKENESLLISGVIKWFLAGAGVLVFGWVIGRSSRRKRGGLSGY